jgi:putative aldouronate transport system permease protein
MSTIQANKTAAAKLRTPYDKLPFYGKIWRDISMSPILYIMLLPVLIYFILFRYKPMYGVLIAFTDFYPGAPILDMDNWIGLRNFTDFFNSRDFLRVIGNTVNISLSTLIIGFPMPIIFALLLNELRSARFSRAIQTFSYLPHFISLVVICGLIRNFVGPYGFVQHLAVFFGIVEPGMSLLNFSRLFVPIYVTSEIWQGMGYMSIIYLAALTGINPELYEAAIVDGANRWRRVLHVTIPGILPTIITMLLLRMGGIMTIGYEKIILLYSPSTYETADVISSFVYRVGLQNARFSFATAVGLFNSAINITILVTANTVSRKLTVMSIF